MLGNDATLEHSSGSWLLNAVVTGLVGLLSVALLAAFDGGPPLARAEMAAPAVLAAASSSKAGAAGLCFHGRGGELLDLAPAGQHCR